MSTRVTRKAWFGPKRIFGWGWTATSWEGWLTCAVFVAGVIGVLVLAPQRAGITVLLLVGALFVVILLTGDSPGGPRRN